MVYTPLAVSSKQSSIEFWRMIFKFNSCSPTRSTDAWRLFLICLQRSFTKPMSESTKLDLICRAKAVAVWTISDLILGSCETFLWSKWRTTAVKIYCWCPATKKEHQNIISRSRYLKSQKNVSSMMNTNRSSLNTIN